MGQLIFTPVQKLIFDEFSKDDRLRKYFYFTGVTALSVFHYRHRYSEDLDFFSETDFADEMVNDFIGRISALLGLKHKYTLVEKTRMFEFDKNGKLLIKIDFGFYPHKCLEKGKIYQGVSIDSLLDIGANKLMTISQRIDSKDFVDLFYLLKKYTLWDLMYAVEKKFRRETDVVLLASDMLQVKQLDTMPKMIKSLSLKTLQKFFTKKARETAGRVVDFD